MATYQTPRHGVSLSDALREAAAVAPIARAMLNTFELYHPTGTPDGPIYVVNDHQPLTATKEAGASRDASATVVFMASNVSINRPEESDSASTPEVALVVSNVSGVFSDALRLTRGSLTHWELIERVYASDDTTAPAVLPPLSLLVVGAEIAPDKVTFRASFGDPANVSVPLVTFKRSEYPGLVR